MNVRIVLVRVLVVVIVTVETLLTVVVILLLVFVENVGGYVVYRIRWIMLY